MDQLTRTAIVSAIVALVVSLGVVTLHGSAVFGTIGAGITNLTGLSITGTPGSFDVSGAATLSGATALNGSTTINGGVLSANPSATTTMTSTETLVVADVNKFDTVLLSPNVTGNTTLTFFASTSASTWLPTAGNHQRVCFINATTTAGTYYTFAGGTGTKLLVASSSATALGAVTIYPQKVGCFDFIRASATATTFDLLGSFVSFN